MSDDEDWRLHGLEGEKGGGEEEEVGRALKGVGGQDESRSSPNTSLPGGEGRGGTGEGHIRHIHTHSRQSPPPPCRVCESVRACMCTCVRMGSTSTPPPPFGWKRGGRLVVRFVCSR